MKTVTVNDILSLLEIKSSFDEKDKKTEIKEVIGFDVLNKNANALMWVNKKNAHKLKNVKQGVILFPSEEEKFLPPKVNCHFIGIDEPRKAFLKILKHFFWKQKTPYLSNSAIINKSTIIGKNVSVGEFVVIEENVTIGDNVSIDHHTVIKENTTIGNHVKIGANTTIGGEGFGYEKNNDGEFEFMPHIGGVTINDYVEIGNNTCIDRGVLGNTTIEENCKIDNLVHIAHGVHIEKNSLIIANSMIAGSVKIGKNCWVAPSSSVMNGIEIGEETTIGLGAVVLRSTPKNSTIIGNPGKPIKK